MLRRLLGGCVCVGAFCIYTFSLLALAVLGRRRSGRDAGARRGLSLLLTGRFDSHNWCRAHLLPLLRARGIGRIIAAVDGPTIAHEKLCHRPAPRWLRRLVGRSPARSLWVLWLTLRCRPDAVLGYHFFPGALSALWAGRLGGAAALYSMTGGPVELLGGGIATESPFVRAPNRFTRLLVPATLCLCRRFDRIIVRGQRARRFLGARGAPHGVEIIPGGIDVARFGGPEQARDYDVVFVGRLVPIKQPQRFLRVLAALRLRWPQLRAAIVGDGPLAPELRIQAAALGLNGAVEFLGHVESVERVLRRSRTFVLTSRSEGLSIAMAEAMAAGVVPVVADVGDLGELVEDGVTGWRIAPQDVGGFARRIHTLLEDPETWQRVSLAARRRAQAHNSLDAVTARWERVVGALREAPAPRRPPTGRCVGRDVVRGPYGTLRVWSNRTYRFWQARIPRWAKSLLKRPLAAVPPQYLLGPEFAAQLRLTRRAEGWSSEQARQAALERVRRMCLLAARTPFYEQLFREAGFDPRELKRLEDLAALPTIDAETLRVHLERMCTVSPRSGGVDFVSTGGTGGRPLHFYMGTGRAAFEYAHLVTSWRRAGYRLGMPLAVFRGRTVPPDRRGLRHEYDPLLRQHHYSVFHLTDENMLRYLAHVRGLGPCFLHVYPSAIAALAGFIRRAALPPPENVRGILAESEIVYPAQRAMVAQVFGCRYFSCYGHTEKVVLAAECERSSDYHVWPSYGYFELLDERGRPVTTPGRRGEIVGTGYANTVVPFIRYRTGDWATYVGERCAACGREQPLIRDIRGHRTQEVLVAGDGSEIPWAALNMHDDTYVRVRQFQFRQDRPGHAVLRIVPAEGFRDADRERIGRGLRRKLEGRLSIRLELASSIPLSARGKAIYVDQRIALARRGGGRASERYSLVHS